MNFSTDEFLMLLARNSLAAGVLVILVLIAQRVFQRQLSPPWRCALWLLVVVRLLPFSLSSPVSIFNLLPGWSGDSTRAAPVATAPKLAASDASIAQPVLIQSPSPSGSTDLPAVPEAEPATTPEDSSSVFTFSWPTVLFLGWLAGALALGAYVIVLAVSLRGSLARALPLRDRDLLALLTTCCDQMGVRRAPLVAESDAVQSPALHGVFRPRLLLPAGFTQKFSAAELRFVFLHELAHLRRRDLLLNWVTTLLQILHWFNPLVWYGFSRWRIDREIACDAAALEASGAHSNRAYGQTMLRLLQNLSHAGPRPGLVGILEDRRQLRRRLTMIANFTPARRPYSAAGLLAILALVGLTDAQVAPTPTSVPTGAVAASSENAPSRTVVPAPISPYVLFLVNASETMLGDLETLNGPAGTNTIPSYEHGRTYGPRPDPASDEQKRAAPKWQRATQTLEQQLRALAAGTDFHVALFFDDTLESIGGRMGLDDRPAINRTLDRMQRIVPRGAANLESAFAQASDTSRFVRPERIVLLTDGLPTASRSLPAAGEITEAQRIRFFELAAKQLPPRIPVHTILIPSAPGDPGAAGLYWELANATRGGLMTPAKPGGEPPTHLAFVIDASGSMRNPNTGFLWPIVIDTIEATLDANPQLTGVQLVDSDGRFILKRSGTGSAGWHPLSPETREAIQRTLRSYNIDGVSNPMPGIYNAIRFLRDKEAPGMRMSVYVLGDEFNSRDPAGTALERMATLNPRDANGRRPITISAIGFPTTIRHQFSMGNTGLRFANLMRLLTQEHDGSFVALPEL